MIRDDLVKQLEKAERRANWSRGIAALDRYAEAKNNLRLWDTAYAAGFTNRDYLLAALEKLRDESRTIVGASDDYKQGREMGVQLCINELTRVRDD